MTTAQQIHSLLSQLETHLEPTTGMLFFQPIQQAKLDYTPASITRLSTLLDQIAKKNYPLDRLITEPKAKPFFLTLAGYLAQYLARTTDEPIVWLNYAEAQTQISKKNREYGTDFQLPQNFDSSLIADIGDGMYCQPLMAIRSHLQGEGKIDTFILEMQQAIFERSQISPELTAPALAEQYLKKVRQGRLLDTTIGFYNELQAVNFDFSEQSLSQIDSVLENIARSMLKDEQNYYDFINQPNYQSFCYLLGVYVGATVAKISDTPIQWADYTQAKMLFQQSDLPHSLEYSLLMVTPSRYYTPILVITNALFDLTADYPSRTRDFLAKFRQEINLDKQKITPLNLQFFPYHAENGRENPNLPQLWQSSMTMAGNILANNLLQIFDGSPALVQIFEYNLEQNVDEKPAFILNHTENFGEISTANSAQVLEQMYQRLSKNPTQASCQIASYGANIALPTQACPAIIIEIRQHAEPNLTLQFMLPYRPAQSSAGFAIYPLLYHPPQRAVAQILSPDILQQLVQSLYASATAFNSPIHRGNFWQNYYLAELGSNQPAPQGQQQDNLTVTSFDVPLLPLEKTPAMVENIPTLSPPPNIEKRQVTNPDLLFEKPNVVNPSFTTDITPIPPAVAPLPPQSISSVPDTPATKPVSASLTASLQEQLRQDQLRLKSELSTSDSDKEKKLITIVAVIGIIIVLALLVAWLKK